MNSGHAHFTNTPEIVTADKLFWLGFLYRNLDKVVAILVEITDDFSCKVCGDLSLNYTSKSSLANHMRHHARATIEFWLKYFINISPEDLESMIRDKNFKRGIGQ